MSTVSDAPSGRQATPSPAIIDLREPAKLRAWLSAFRDAVLDCAAAGEDATRRPKKRTFSRVEARRRIEAARGSLLVMIEAAERGATSEAPG